MRTMSACCLRDSLKLSEVMGGAKCSWLIVRLWGAEGNIAGAGWLWERCGIREDLVEGSGKVSSPAYEVLHPELHHGGPTPTFVLWRLRDRRHVRVLLQVLAQGLAQNAHAAAVDNAYFRHPCQEGAVYEFFDLAGGVVDVLADDVDFGGCVQVAGVVFERDFDAASTGRLHGRVRDTGDHFRDVFSGDAHFHGTDFDFEVIFVDFLFDHTSAAHGFQLHG